MDTSTTLTPVGQNTSSLADRDVDSAYGAITSTECVANAAFDRLADSVESVRDTGKEAESAVNRGVEAVRDLSAQLRKKGMMVSETTVTSIRDEPIKAMVIAAVAGAALVALLRLMTRSRSAA
jgi:hypothetical protein